jgi:periplasmic protein TonB
MLRGFPLEMVVGLGASIIVHGLFLLGNAQASSRTSQSVPSTIEFAIDVPPLPVDPLLDKEPVPVPQEKVAAAPSVDRTPATPTASKLPQSGAQAGKTLVAPDAPAGPEQVADFSLVQGGGESYAGGTTSSVGVSTSGVRRPVAPSSSSAVAALSVPLEHRRPAAPDLSRPAVPSSADWNCSRLFPSDPDAPNTAVVNLVVTVRGDGSARSASVVRDPGHGFGAAASTCAMGQRYSPALDSQGNPLTTVTAPITVRFSR